MMLDKNKVLLQEMGWENCPQLQELNRKASLEEFLLESDKFENFVYSMQEANKYL